MEQKNLARNRLQILGYYSQEILEYVIQLYYCNILTIKSFSDGACASGPHFYGFTIDGIRDEVILCCILSTYKKHFNLFTDLDMNF